MDPGYTIFLTMKIPVHQAGAIVFRIIDRQVKILLIRSKKDPTKWVFPKGHLEDGESEEEASRRELYEEAGIEGEIVKKTGILNYCFGGKNYEVVFFLFRFLKTSGMGEPGREPSWFSAEEALRRVLPNSRDLLQHTLSLISEIP